jgi:hypothetical protein
VRNKIFDIDFVLRLKNELLISCALLLLLSFISCSDKTKNEVVIQSGTPVTVTNPTVTSLTDYMTFNANTTFLSKEIVRSTFQGFIKKVYKNIGDNIKTGDVIFQIITKEAYAADNLKLKLNGEPFSGTILLKAKTNGVLTELNYNTGDFVSDGEQLAIISNPNSLAVLLNVPYQHAAKIKLKSNCNIILPDGKSINGRISKSLPSVDPISQTQTFIVNLLEINKYPANLNVEIKIPVSVVKGATTLPRTAIQSSETLDSFWIMKLMNDTTAVKVLVEKGLENDSLVQILKPSLDLLEKIIIDGAYGLTDTSKVEIKK